MRLRTPSHKLLFSIAAIAIVAIVVIDRFLKLVAYQNLDTNTISGGLFVPTTNEGIAFGITIAPLIIIVVSTFISVGLLIVLAHVIVKHHWLQSISILSIILGASSNLWDRVQYGFVIDYLSLPLTHINLADVLITVGAAVLVYSILSTRPQKINWKKHNQIRSSLPPSRLLAQALENAPKSGVALDLGAGGLQDSRYLLSLGYQVIAVDNNPTAAALAREIKDPRFSFLQQSFENFEFIPGHYGVISAQFALPFIQNKADLLRVAEAIKSSLTVGGVFAGQFFGPHDTWCLNNWSMTFLNREEVEELFKDMEVLFITEREFDHRTTTGLKKHSHLIPVIVRKRQPLTQKIKEAAPEIVSGLMLKALPHAPKSGQALDLGAGALNESKYLLSLGYTVTAVDREESVQQFVAQINNPKFTFALSSFEDFEFLSNTYELIVAERSLPFISQKKELVRVIKNIKKSLKVGGVFVGQFFGPKDTWCINDRPMTFLTKQEVEGLFTDMEVILIGEREYDGTTELGQKKHWHMFPVIVKKIN